ncbi:MAG: hypothetical protein M3N68_05835, partial [Actinomycetota bacterium]|nr:hypothetical protein [Actinomycetota bacterium]
MKKVLVATFALALAVAAAAPAAAEPARASTAHAFGLEARGLVPIARSPDVRAAYPPGGDSVEAAPVAVPLATLVIDSTGRGRAQAHLADDIAPILTEATDNDRIEDGPFNARAYGAVDNLDVVAPAGAVLENQDVLDEATSLLNLNAIEAEATARCVDNRPVFDVGWNIADVDLFGTDNPIGLEDLVEGVLLPLVAPTGVLAPVVQVTTPAEDPSFIRIGPNSASVLAARITILNLLGGVETIDVGFAEVSMPSNCA